MQIKDKRVVVTGAASDVGLAFSKELLRNGALVSSLILYVILTHILYYIIRTLYSILSNSLNTSR